MLFRSIVGDNELGNDYSFLSSHPMTSERIENAKKELKENKCASGDPNPKLERLFLQMKGEK